MNLYEYVRSAPRTAVDPTGLGGETTSSGYTPRPASAKSAFEKPGCCCVFTVMVQTANLNWKGTGEELLDSLFSSGSQGHAWVRLEDQRDQPVYVVEGGHTGENKGTKKITGEKYGFGWGIVKLQPQSYTESDWDWVKQQGRLQGRLVEVWETEDPADDQDPGWLAAPVRVDDLADPKNPIRWIQYQFMDGVWHDGHGGHHVTHQASWCLDKDKCKNMRDAISRRQANGATNAGNNNDLVNRFGGFEHGCANTVVRIGEEGGIKLNALVQKALPPRYKGFRLWTQPQYSWVKFNLPDKLKDTWNEATPDPDASVP